MCSGMLYVADEFLQKLSDASVTRGKKNRRTDARTENRTKVHVENNNNEVKKKKEVGLHTYDFSLFFQFI